MTSNLRRHAVRHLRSLSLRTTKEHPEAITTHLDQSSLTACAPYSQPLQWLCTRNSSSSTAATTTGPSSSSSRREATSPCRTPRTPAHASLPPSPACSPRSCWAAHGWSAAVAAAAAAARTGAGSRPAAFGTLALQIPGSCGSEAIGLYGRSGWSGWSAALLAARRLPRQPEPFEDEYDDDEYEDGEWVDLDDEDDLANDLGMLDGGEDEFDAWEDEEGGEWEEAEEEDDEAPPPPPNPRPNKNWRNKQ